MQISDLDDNITPFEKAAQSIADLIKVSYIEDDSLVRRLLGTTTLPRESIFSSSIGYVRNILAVAAKQILRDDAPPGARPMLYDQIIDRAKVLYI
ncbi:MAG: hypothetical protein KDB61_16960, partial [Planctomycetes bacterium]|nr:hypothetical protein [Planctomycetota bacterium]